MTASEKIQKKLDSMTDFALSSCHDSLRSIDPRVFGPNGWKELWNSEHDITMENWAECVSNEMYDRRK